MCGIAGYFSQKHPLPISIGEALKLNHHRGPDDNNFYQHADFNFYLFHNRLRIVDLSDNSRQPFWSSDKRYVMVFNGEIYNFKDVKSKLLKIEKIDWSSHGDTEVIVEGYRLIGTKIFDHLDGIFACAIYDTLNNQLLLARDHFGVKPLYYYKKSGVFAFSSELASLIKLINNEMKFDRDLIYSYLQQGYSSAPNTFYEHIKKVEAGTFITIDTNDLTSLKITYYYDLKNKISAVTHNNEKQILSTVKELLIQSVQKQLMGDVNIAALLSGGIDSSLLISIAKVECSYDLETFTVGYSNKTFDESPYAQSIAKHLNLPNNIKYLDKSTAKNFISEAITCVGEPFGDSSIIPSLFVSQDISQKAKVAFSGDGGDELFHGYGTYTWANRLALIRKFNIHRLLLFILSSIDLKQTEKYKHMLNSSVNPLEIFSIENGLFNKSDLKNLSNNQCASTFSSNNTQRKLKPSEIQSLFDIEKYLREDLLVKMDRSSMRYGLEIRVPFLDRTLVEYSLNINPKIKMKHGIRKYVLRQILKNYLPSHYFERQKKGFSIDPEYVNYHDIKGEQDVAKILAIEPSTQSQHFALLSLNSFYR